jgi:hypothetical protein
MVVVSIFNQIIETSSFDSLLTGDDLREIVERGE